MWKTTFIGALGQDAELKKVGDGPCCSFSVAVNYFDKKEKLVAWIDVSLFGARAEKVAPLLVKGTKVVVSGSMKLRSYVSKDGPKTVADVRADDVEIAQYADHAQGGDEREEAPAFAPRGGGYGASSPRGQRY